ncbi:MAG: hypothetical protein KatS3mg109_1723 [Pirellulaceae bacterium]|nr:MAG: hypothetical protein KatS3mg109_1723 [Pirellulaceae bacterium]
MATNKRQLIALCGLATLFMTAREVLAQASQGGTDENRLPAIKVSEDGKGFVVEGTSRPFVPWGFNYLGVFGKLAEEQWHTEEGWQRIERDFRLMKQLGANVVRWHLQFPTYMSGPRQANPDQLKRLRKLLVLARQTGLYLDLTGLNLFRKEAIPAWYDAMSEEERWETQAYFWEVIARTCAGDSAVFCYDLTNEPVVVAAKEGEHPWVAGELGGLYFVQRISHNRQQRPQSEIAAAWANRLSTAIRQQDKRTLITVGVIPWSFVWKGAKPVFYTEATRDSLDFVSIHVYPKSGNLANELEALKAYDVGKPLVIEEIFPLECSIQELDQFIDAARPQVSGWISHFFGYSIEEHRGGAEPAGPLVAEFLQFWSRKKKDVVPQ